MLTELNLKSVYDSSEDNLINDLFIPLLSHSKLYQRGVGFFTSGWLAVAAQGLTKLAENEGKAILITSPILESADWEAMLEGEQARKNDYLRSLLERHVKSLEETLTKRARVALSWMVADGLLDIHFAVPKNRMGDFHDKFAVFVDSNGNRVAIHGSFNDSVKGTLNGESFSVFRSWEQGQVEYVNKHQQRFDHLLANTNQFFDVYEIPDAVRDSVIRLRGHSSRPYRRQRFVSITVPEPAFPDGLKLHDFQQEAVKSWQSKECRGIFAMATGTGKTITSIAAALALTKEKRGFCTVIAVPFIHLIDQWKEDLVKFNFNPFIASGNKRSWIPELRRRLSELKLGVRDNLCVLTTHTTLSKGYCNSLFSPVLDRTLLIADEAHYLGARQLQKALIPCAWRLGLSATPERWYDPRGTEYLMQYFEGVVAEFDVRDAINSGFLTPYNYFVHLYELTEDENQQFARITARITSERNSDHPDEEKIEQLLRQRARIIATAERKMPLLQEILENKISEVGLDSIRHTLLYSAPGQTSEVMSITSQLGLRAREFIHTVPRPERQQILGAFNRGDLQALVAVKCLDEGVNIPPTRTAIISSSTTNPREFVQRLGRVLRRSEGKTSAEIHDFIPLSSQTDIAISLLKRELPRIAEFTRTALNGADIQRQLQPMLIDFGLAHLANQRPWDIYHSILEEGVYE